MVFVKRVGNGNDYVAITMAMMIAMPVAMAMEIAMTKNMWQ